RDDTHCAAFVSKLFGQRDELAKIKGEAASGVDLNLNVVGLMADGPKKLQTTLSEAHASLNADELRLCFGAALHALPAPQVFGISSPYLTATVDEKKKKRDLAWAKREAVCDALGAGEHSFYWADRHESGPPLDPRWLDAAVSIEHLGLMTRIIRPGHAG